MDNQKINVAYTPEFEDLLKFEGEKAESMSILHSLASNKYNFLSVAINIPVIVLSAIVGFLGPIEMFKGQAIVFGAITICISILKTFDSYFNWTKRAESHRISGLSYLKISKFIEVQLSLERECRINANDNLEIITKDIQNLRESEKTIPADIINEFNKKYGKYTTAKPSIVNGLTIIQINKKQSLTPRHSFYNARETNVITESNSDIELGNVGESVQK